MQIWMGPTGKLVKGHVLDVNKRAFEETLQFYDPLLYVRWNDQKYAGRGCWEVRRKPEFNTAVDICEYQGALIFRVEPYENDLVHHVLDTQFLNYDILRYLKQQDTFQYGNDPKTAAIKWQEARESATKSAEEAAKEHGMQLRREAARTFKNEIRAFKDYVRSGGNPHLIARDWDRVKASE